MTSINCIAIDDEPPALRQITEYISKLPYLKLIAEFQNPIDSMIFLKHNQVDLIFLDVQMENLSGIEILRLLKNKPSVILTTAHDSYALEAFDLDVDDYLLKPISFERFVKATEKIYAKLINKDIQTVLAGDDQKDKKEYFFIKTEFKIRRINFNEILYIEGSKEYLKIVLDNDIVLTKLSFNQILEDLPGSDFLRVHKSFVVSVGKIQYIRNNRIYLGKVIIPVGSTYREGFLDSIKK